MTYAVAIVILMLVLVWVLSVERRIVERSNATVNKFHQLRMQMMPSTDPGVIEAARQAAPDNHMDYFNNP